MPVGIITNVGVVLVAGTLGGMLGKYIPRKIVDFLMAIFGFCSLTIGVTAVVKLDSLTLVIVSVLLGSVFGTLMDIDAQVTRAINTVTRRIDRSGSGGKNEARTEYLCMVAAIVCFSGTGIFGALSEGLDGDSSILLAKSVLDFFSLIIFAVELGYTVALLALPQALIYAILFLTASLLAPVFTPQTVGNFKAVGGVLTIVIGYNLIGAMSGLKKIKVLNMIPALAVILLLSWLCAKYGVRI